MNGALTEQQNKRLAGILHDLADIITQLGLGLDLILLKAMIDPAAVLRLAWAMKRVIPQLREICLALLGRAPYKGQWLWE